MIKPLSAHRVPGQGWIRVFGAGFAWKDTTRFPLLFSERSGHVSRVQVGRWSFKLLRRSR